MKWYEKQYNINNALVTLTGTFEDSEIKIDALIQTKDGSSNLQTIYKKPINMWVYQDIIAEDVLAKYQGMIKKCEQKLPILIERIELKKRI